LDIEAAVSDQGYNSGFWDGYARMSKDRARDEAGYEEFYADGGTIRQWDSLTEKEREKYRKRAERQLKE